MARRTWKRCGCGVKVHAKAQRVHCYVCERKIRKKGSI